MPEPRLFRGSFLDELKRRKVVRVGIVYAAVAWAVTQVADVALSSFQAPQWVMQVVIVLLVLGFPVAVALAWAFDVTPEGVRRTARPAGTTAGAPASEGGEPVAGSVPPGPSSDAEHALADSLVAAFPFARDAWWSGPQALRAQAAVYARVGRADEAIDIVRRLVPPPSWYTPASLGIDPAFEPLRDHPRWPEVIEAAR